jgi:alpha-ketoglutarate-dependent 2,4-dichlorophenoxyacetate dioxygenase
MAITVRQIHRLFVGEVTGVDLSKPLDPATKAEIDQAIYQHAVLVFPDQPITDAQQIAFSENFGPLETSIRKLRQDNKDRLDLRVSDISNLNHKNELLGQHERRHATLLANQLWHTDSSFKTVPARYSMLSARVVPPVRADTEFADMRAAYDALDTETRASIEGLRVYHSIVYSRHVLGFDFSEDEQEKLKGAVHPLVRTIPGSGRRALYLASHAAHVVDWPVPEGRLLLRDLTDHATQPQFVYRHIWRPHDFVIWDNRCTMHRARPFDDKTHRRELRRTTSLDLPLPASA